MAILFRGGVLEEDKEVIDDDFDPIPFPTSNTKLGDIFILGNHRLMCGDSTLKENVDQLLDGDVVDLFYTDPPYNVNVSNSQGDTIQNDDLPEDAFINILLKAFENGSSVLKEGGSFYCWHGDSERVNFQLCLEKHGLIVKQCLIWVKNGFNFGRQDYKWQHEPCLYGWKEGSGHYFVPEFNLSTVKEEELNIKKMTKEELVKFVENLLANIPSDVFHENKPIKNDLHPTMKPITLCGTMIHNSSRKGEVVLDLFGGSGSTLIACEQLGRNARLMELDPKYVDVIVRRYIKYMGSTDGCHLIRNGEQLPLPKEFESAII